MAEFKKRIVIVGGGFGGLSAAQALKNSPYEITIIDKTNHHLFQPLLYQVATAALSPADIAMPIRAIFTANKNIQVKMDEVWSIDIENKFVEISNSKISFDYLILALGTRHSYFGKPEWEKIAPGLKTLNDALVIREKILLSLEEAEKLNDKTGIDKYLTFVIVGGGPTGVELAGAIAEIAKQTMMKDFRNINAEKTKVILIEGSSRILSSYPESLSKKAKIDLEKFGVKVILNQIVQEIGSDYVRIADKIIKTKNIIWAAGNEAPSLLKSLHTKMDKAGRVLVNQDCSIHNHENIFVIGDAASFLDKKGNLLPGVAPVAIQQGKYVAKIILEEKKSGMRVPFTYMDKGNLATIGKAKAIAEIRGLKFSGLFAWLTWSFVHILFLIGYRNRVRVMAEWIWNYITKQHGIRLIVGKAKNN
ncbi:MAG: pyridine nucleotide-disulfide oxidoreductase [Ignavibacteria bacterium RIFOXYB2_FULL_35_12]|nr:MAG: pyridine nucleotide-disulfide oxidoreductase [Ignavibacteria bacterium GWA2_36_19]OGU50634.1 MAG: pyridine nucleotide-disulfide oxidoreductase [Ignavibacteria bacterium GWC2_35_8]OGU59100.1 MAG: pyridine nucleotide-disulfide oxidoreductase [Ignavibacteria bacterium GWF2_35_20]OGU79351.1 MAG: pyridine nucleotide-disulfide oxidoreductase [Ignavibacteria bacterium RIFOXYA2_FULL_35_9]OGU83535.1 MAG: pyridine nucleotide-disulfide oxidoreductase [Ignavibacteria bacterium RBG_16_35_7]OGU88634